MPCMGDGVQNQTPERRARVPMCRNAFPHKWKKRDTSVTPNKYLVNIANQLNILNI